MTKTKKVFPYLGMQLFKPLTNFFIVIILTISCRTTKLNTPGLAVLQSKPVSKVLLKELLLNGRKYQRQIIETEGELVYGFEDFSIHYHDTFLIGNNTVTREVFFGLGLELHHDLHLERSYLESLRGKRIKVRGIFDTTDYQKLSGLPEQGLLKNVFFFEPLDK